MPESQTCLHEKVMREGKKYKEAGQRDRLDRERGRERGREREGEKERERGRERDREIERGNEESESVVVYNAKRRARRCQGSSSRKEEGMGHRLT